MHGLFCQLGVVMLGQVGADPAVPPAGVDVESVWDFILKGGPVMVPIILCSFVVLAVFVERMVTLRRASVIPPSFLPGLKAQLGDNAKDCAGAIAYCENNPSPLANVLLAAVKKLGRSPEIVEKHIQEAGEREAMKLRKFLRLFIVVAAIAPLMGLLGTILGMIEAFRTVAVSADALGKTAMLAGGIYEAMITTAAGLLLAIPVLVAYHWLSARVEQLVVTMDQLSVDFLEEFVSPPSTPEVVTQTTLPVTETQASGFAKDGDGQARESAKPVEVVA